jgi:hypothetical protein
VCGLVGSYAPHDGGASGACQWTKRYGEPPAVASATNQSAGRIVAAGDGSDVIIAGKLSDGLDLGLVNTYAGKYGVFVARVRAATGEPLWVRVIENSTAEIRGLAAQSSGIVITGRFTSGKMVFDQTWTTQGAATFVAKLASDGTPQWSRAYEIASVDVNPGSGDLSAVGLDGAGNVYAGGAFHGSIKIGNDTWSTAAIAAVDLNAARDLVLVKLDKDGALQWSRSWGDGANQGLGSLAVGSPGDVFMVGEYAGTLALGNGIELQSAGGADAARADAFVARVEPNAGVVQWATSYGDWDGRQWAQDVTLDASGLVAVGTFKGQLTAGGKTVTAPGPAPSFFALGMSLNGSVSGVEAWTGAQEPSFAFVTPAPGGVFIAGRFGGSSTIGSPPLQSAGQYDAFVARVSPSGQGFTTQWAARFGDGAMQTAQGVAVAAGNVLVYGSFKGQIDLGCGPLTATHFDPCADAGAGEYDVFLGALAY